MDVAVVEVMEAVCPRDVEERGSLGADRDDWPAGGQVVVDLRWDPRLRRAAVVDGENGGVDVLKSLVEVRPRQGTVPSDGVTHRGPQRGGETAPMTLS